MREIEHNQKFESKKDSTHQTKCLHRCKVSKPSAIIWNQCRLAHNGNLICPWPDKNELTCSVPKHNERASKKKTKGVVI